MTPALDHLKNILKQLPGLGYRSAERLALHLLVEQPERLTQLVEALEDGAGKIKSCPKCGNLCEQDLCFICLDKSREQSTLCIIEHVTDLAAFERSGAYRGQYHVLHGKLSPINGVGPEQLNFESLKDRLKTEEISEIILALSNDIEGEATCHYIQEELISRDSVSVTRIGFGLPSGGGVTYADPVTLQSALDGRKTLT